MKGMPGSITEVSAGSGSGCIVTLPAFAGFHLSPTFPGTWMRSAAVRLAPLILGLSLLVQTCALPIPVAFLLVGADAEQVTEGCDRKTCCTALCYVDKHGEHRCVHKHTEACARGTPDDASDAVPVLCMTLATLPDAARILPALRPSGRVRQAPSSAIAFYPVPPSLPPK